MFKQIAHVCLHVSNLERAMAFYRDRMKLNLRFTFERNGRAIGANFDAGGGTFLEMFETKNAAPVNNGIVHFCFETDDIETDVADLRTHGVECTDIKAGSDRSLQSWLQDPDGNKLELHQYTPESAQKIGGVVPVKWG